MSNRLSILKNKLTEIVEDRYFKQPSLINGKLEVLGLKTKVEPLQFIEIHRGVTYFLRASGSRKKFYDSIKGLLYHTKEEADIALEKQLKELHEQAIKNNLREITKIQKRIEAYKEMV